jgi:hypothetical protein
MTLRNSTLRMLGGALAAGLLGGCSHSSSDLATTGKRVTDYYCAPDAVTVRHITETLSSADEDDYQDAIRFSIGVGPGTKVRVIKRVDQPTSAVEVNILDGPYAGYQCWYPGDVADVLIAAQ